jgi:siroheme synthase
MSLAQRHISGVKKALALLLLAAPALAQESPKVTVSMTMEQAQLVVQTLGQIGCQNVTQMAVCQQAVELLRDMREQLRAQVK